MLLLVTVPDDEFLRIDVADSHSRMGKHSSWLSYPRWTVKGTAAERDREALGGALHLLRSRECLETFLNLGRSEDLSPCCAESSRLEDWMR